jgi:hypothetical protein
MWRTASHWRLPHHQLTSWSSAGHPLIPWCTGALGVDAPFPPACQTWPALDPELAWAIAYSSTPSSVGALNTIGRTKIMLTDADRVVSLAFCLTCHTWDFTSLSSWARSSFSPVAQPLNPSFLRLSQPSRAPLGIGLMIIAITALMFNLSVQGSSSSTRSLALSSSRSCTLVLLPNRSWIGIRFSLCLSLLIGYRPLSPWHCLLGVQYSSRGLLHSGQLSTDGSLNPSFQ